MQVFTTNHQDIKDRLDCDYYKPEFVKLEKKLLNHNAIKLGTLLKSITNGLDYRKFSEEGTLNYLRVSNIKPYKIDYSEAKRVKLNRADISKNIFGKKDDVLLTRKGTYGVSVYLEQDLDALISSEVFLLKIKTDKINSGYLSIFLNSPLGQKQFLRNKVGAIMGSLSQQAVKNTHIVIPSENEQKKIVQELSSAITSKNKKLKQADELLNSIDDYVRQQLGIDYKEPEKKPIFTTLSDVVVGKRLDPKKYSQKPKAIIFAIKNSKYKTIALNDLIVEKLSGQWGYDTFNEEAQKDNDNLQVKVLRNTNFNNSLNLDLENVAERLINKERFEKIKLQSGDILVEKSGGSPIQPVGRVAIFDSIQGDFCFSNFLQCIRIDTNQCLPYYLFAYLKSIYELGYMEYLQNQTTGIKNLIWEEFADIPVVLPPKEMQEQVISEVRDKMKQSITLKNEASKLLKKAKKEVEEMILN